LSSRHSVVPEYLQSLRNVAISLGEPHDPRLPSGLVNVEILVQMVSRHTALQPGPCAKTRRAGRHCRCLREVCYAALVAVGCREMSFDRRVGSGFYLAIFAPVNDMRN
jgi:hypothetical protein